MQLLVARAGGAQRELVDPVAAPRRVGVAVDEPGDRAEPATVELLELAVERGQVAHAPDRRDRVAVAEDERVVDHVDRARASRAASGAPFRRQASRPARGRGRAAVRAPTGTVIGYASSIGVDRPCSRAAATASG